MTIKYRRLIKRYIKSSRSRSSGPWNHSKDYSRIISMVEDKEAQVEQAGSTTSAEDKTTLIEVPDGGYGWVIVLAVGLFNMSTWAANSGYSIYLAHYLQYHSFDGAGKLDYAAVGGIAFGVGLFLSPLTQIYIRLTSIKITILTGGVFQLSGTLLAAFSTRLWELYLTQGLLISFGLAFVCIPANTILPQWFRKKRSLAQALAASGSGLGGIMFNLAVERIVNVKSVRWALIVQGIICAFGVTVGVLLTKTRNKEIKVAPKIWNWNVFLSFPFCGLFLYVGLTLLGYVVLLYNLADFTISLGYSSTQGSIVSCMVSVGVTFGRPIVGYLGDLYGAFTVASICSVIVGIFCLAMWIPIRNYASAIAFGIIQGAMMGTIWALLATLAARMYGLRQLSTALGMLWVAIGGFGTVSPIIGIKLRATAVNGEQYSPEQYRNPAIYCGCMYLGAGVLGWLLRAYLIARDEIALEQKIEMDNDESHIRVPFRLCMSKLFVRSKIRNV